MNEYEIKARFTTTAEERKIIRDRLNKFTTPFGKKEGCDRVTTKRDDKKGGSAGYPFSIPIHSCRTSLKSKLNGGQNGH